MLCFQGWYIVTYALGIYHLNLFIAFLSPKVDPSLLDEGKLTEPHQTDLFIVHLSYLLSSQDFLLMLSYSFDYWYLFFKSVSLKVKIKEWNLDHLFSFSEVVIKRLWWSFCHVSFRWGPIPSYQSEWGVPPFHQEVARIQILVGDALMVWSCVMISHRGVANIIFFRITRVSKNQVM